MPPAGEASGHDDDNAADGVDDRATAGRATGGVDDRATAGRATGGVDDRAAEIERMRAEVAELRAAEVARRASPVAGRRMRWILCVALAALAGLLAILAVHARYLRSQVLDTDRYVATVSPLADEPSVQQAVADRVATAVLTELDVESLVEEAFDRLAEVGAPDALTSLAVPVTGQVESFVRDQVDAVVRSEQFARLWDEGNRRAHDRVVALLTGETGREALLVEDGVVAVDLGVVVDRVRERLVDRGFEVAGGIPDVESTLTLVESERLDDAQAWVRWLDGVATALPFVVLVVAAAAILAAPDRRRGVLAVALSIAVAMVLVALALALARVWYLDNATGEALPRDAALDIARTLLAPLRQAMRAVLATGLLVALVAFLVGPSGPARGVRSLGRRVRSGARGRLEGGREPSAVEAWVGAHRGVLRSGIVAVGVLVLAFWTYPSAAVVLAIALLVLAGLVVVELVGRTGGAGAPGASGA